MDAFWQLWLGPLCIIGAWIIGTLMLTVAWGAFADAWKHVHSVVRKRRNQ